MPSDLVRLDPQEIGRQIVTEDRLRRDMALALIDGPATVLQRLPENQQLQDSYGAVQDAAEAGDYDAALKLFRRTLLVRDRYHEAASDAADRAIEKTSGIALLSAVDKLELEAAAMQAHDQAERLALDAPQPQLPRAERRRQIREQRKRHTKPKRKR